MRTDEGFESRLKDHCERFFQLLDEYWSKLDAEQNRHKGLLKEKENILKTEMNDLLKDRQGEIKSIEREHSTLLQNYNEKKARELKEIEKQFIKKLRSIRKSIEVLEVRKENALTKHPAIARVYYTNDHERRLNALKNRERETLEDQKAEFNNIEVEFEEKILSALEEKQNKMREKEKNHSKEIEELNKNHGNILDTVRKSLDAEFESFVERCEENIMGNVNSIEFCMHNFLKERNRLLHSTEKDQENEQIEKKKNLQEINEAVKEMLETFQNYKIGDAI